MKKKALLIPVIVFSAFLMCNGNVSAGSINQKDYRNHLVSIEKKDTYYKVVLDYRNNPSPYNVGKEYFENLKMYIPDIEELLDSYLTETCYYNKRIYKIGIARTKRLRKNIPHQYRMEIKGMSSALTNPGTDKLNDGKLSLNELFALNVFPDIGRGTACSGISVWGSLSKTGTVITGRNLDWNPGSKGQLYRINAITTILYSPSSKKRSICMIGFCGMSSVITGFNNKGLFGGILDSSTGQRYQLHENYRSYVMDLRQALEESDNISEISRYMTDPLIKYAYNHLILVSDSTESKVIENYIYGEERRVRNSRSGLHQGVQWEEDNAICTVNSFLLKSNYDNHTDNPFNNKRFYTYKKLLKKHKNSSPGKTINIDNIKEMITFRKKGLYLFDSQVRSIFLTGQAKTLHSIIFVPQSKELKIYFRNNDRSWNRPSFKTIKIFQ